MSTPTTKRLMGEQGDKQFIGWICGLPTDKTKAVAIADVLLFRQPFRKLCSEASPTPKAFGRNNKKDATGKRLAQCLERKVRLIRRSSGITWSSQYIPQLVTKAINATSIQLRLF